MRPNEVGARPSAPSTISNLCLRNLLKGRAHMAWDRAAHRAFWGTCAPRPRTSTSWDRRPGETCAQLTAAAHNRDVGLKPGELR